MKNRYRVEIFDEIKDNDLTIYSDEGVNKEYLTELVFSNNRDFSCLYFCILSNQKIFQNHVQFNDKISLDGVHINNI